MSETAIGVDLGTSNSCVAVVEGEGATVIPNRWGERIHASVVSFLDDGRVLVGNEAKKGILLDPQNTVYAAKRLIGRFYSSPEVQKAGKLLPFQIVQGPSDSVRIRVKGEDFSLSDIAAFILREMKALAEDYLSRPVEKAVITVPAYFNDNQRQATKDAGSIAGLEVIRILNEPTAAALAHGYGGDQVQRVAVYDLGGGTFDISVLEVGGGIYEVLSSAGDTYLGGEDFDNRLADVLAGEFQRTTGIDLRGNHVTSQRLKEAAEWAKIRLSAEERVTVELPGIAVDDNGRALGISRTVTRAEFSALILEMIQRTLKVTEGALEAAGLTCGEVEGIILVGGPTRLPVVRDAVSTFFRDQPIQAVNPDEVVAVGAAMQAHNLVTSSRSAVLLDVTPLTLSVGTVGGYVEPLIARNTPIPCERTKTFTTSRDGQDRVVIRVMQGESARAEENELLGEFEFTGFRVGYRGEVRIDVSFEIDTDGIVNVSARDQDTGKQSSMVVRLSSGLSRADIKRSIERGSEIQIVERR
jgi:molecular chaperone DnaK